MFIDLHMHEKTYSLDSFLSLNEIVSIARQKGLDAICITDHDSMGLKEDAARYGEEIGFPIFVGVEYYSLQGDIVAFGIDDFPQERIPAQEFINMVKARDGICFSAHPFRNNNRGLEDNLAKVKGLDGVEVLNGSTSPEANLEAVRYANALNLITVATSDCHVPEKVGVYATYFPKKVKTLKEFIAVFKEGNLKPAYYQEGEYHIWDMNQKLVVNM